MIEAGGPYIRAPVWRAKQSGSRMQLEAHGVAILRGERLLMHGLDLSIGDGEALVLVGPNGAGKSTLLRVLAGLRRPDAGRLTWDGVPISDDPPAHARRIALLGHLDAVKPGLTAAENLRLPCRLSARPAAAIGAALDQVGLAALADISARHLSSGQTRRLAIARLLLSRATLLLLDEPTTGLDAASVAALGVVLAAHRATGGAVVATTHLTLPLADARTLSLGPA